MNRRQKLILVGLAVTNLLVVGLMVTIVVLATRRDRPQATIPAPALTLTRCEADLLPALADAGYAPSVTWETQEARIHLEMRTANDTPVQPDPQLLWAALDALASSIPATCRTPRTITISLSVTTEGEAHHYTGRFAGPSLQAWRAGELSDEAFAAESRFRATERSVP